MPDFGYTERAIKWINSLDAGTSFSLSDVQEALEKDGLGDAIRRDQVSTAMARIVRYDIGVSRAKAQGVFLWEPPARKRRPTLPPKPVQPSGAAPRPKDVLVPPLAIAGAGAAEPVSAPVPPVVEPRPAPRLAVDVYAQPPVRPAGGLSEGDPIMFTYLAALNGSGAFLALGDHDRKVYRISEVNG